MVLGRVELRVTVEVLVAIVQMMLRDVMCLESGAKLRDFFRSDLGMHCGT